MKIAFPSPEDNKPESKEYWLNALAHFQKKLDKATTEYLKEHYRKEIERIKSNIKALDK